MTGGNNDFNEFVLNGTVRFETNDTSTFQRNIVVMLHPRHVEALNGPGKGVTSPYLTRGQMACCPDMDTEECKTLIRQKKGCPLKKGIKKNCSSPDPKQCIEVVSYLPTFLPLPNPSTGLDGFSECKTNSQCVQLSGDGFEKIGDTVDLMQHTNTLPMDLKFKNVPAPEFNGDAPSKILFHRSFTHFFEKEMFTETPLSSPHVLATSKEGFYIGNSVSKKVENEPLSFENPLIVLDLTSGESHELDPMECYTLDDSGVSASITLEDGSVGTIYIGDRLIRKDGTPGFAIGFDDTGAGQMLKGKKGQSKSSIKKITFLSDLEETSSVKKEDFVKYFSKSKRLSSTFITFKTTALFLNPEDAKYRFKYYCGISLPESQIDPLFIMNNAGAGEEWQRGMEIQKSSGLRNDEDDERIEKIEDMHTFMGIRDDESLDIAKLKLSQKFYDTAKKRNDKKSLVEKLMGSQYELRWPKDGYLEIKKREEAAENESAKPSTSAVEQVDMFASLETLSLRNKCIIVRMSVSHLDFDNAKLACSDIKINHVFSRYSGTFYEPKDVLDKCVEDVDVHSRLCMEAARNASETDLNEGFADILMKYCKGRGKLDPRCSDERVFSEKTFAKIDTDTSPDYSDELAKSAWPLLIVFAAVILWCFYKIVVLTDNKKKNEYASLLMSLVGICIVANYFFPMKVKNMFDALKQNLNINTDKA